MENLGLYLTAIGFWAITLILLVCFYLTKTNLKTLLSNFEEFLKKPSNQDGLEVALRVLSNTVLMAFLIDQLSLYSNIEGKESIKFYLFFVPSVQFFFSLAFGIIMLIIGLDIYKYFLQKEVSINIIRIYLILLPVVQTIIIVPSLIDF